MVQAAEGTGPAMPTRWGELGTGEAGVDVVPTTMGAAGLGLVGLGAGMRLLVVWIAEADPATALVRGPLVVMALTGYGLVAGAIGGAAASWSAARWVRHRRLASLPLLVAGAGTATPPLVAPVSDLTAPGLYLTVFSGIWLTAHLLLDRVARRRALTRR